MLTDFYYSKGSATKRTHRQTTKKYFNAKNYKFQQDPYQLDIQDRIRESQTRRRVSMLPRKCFEYQKQYEMVLPSNPALRSLPKTDVDSIVSRLCSSKKYFYNAKSSEEIKSVEKNKIPNQDCARTGSILPLCRRCSCCHSVSSAYRVKHKTRTKEQIKEMVERLSAAKLYDSDFHMGRLIRFPSIRSLDSLRGAESKQTSLPSLYSAVNSLGGFQYLPLRVHEKQTHFPEIKQVSCSGLDDASLKISVTVKPKETPYIEKESYENNFSSARREMKSRYSDRTRNTV